MPNYNASIGDDILNNYPIYIESGEDNWKKYSKLDWNEFDYRSYYMSKEEKEFVANAIEDIFDLNNIIVLIPLQEKKLLFRKK